MFRLKVPSYRTKRDVSVPIHVVPVHKAGAELGKPERSPHEVSRLHVSVIISAQLHVTFPRSITVDSGL